METSKITEYSFYSISIITFLKFLPKINEQIILTIKQLIEQWRKF